MEMQQIKADHRQDFEKVCAEFDKLISEKGQEILNWSHACQALELEKHPLRQETVDWSSVCDVHEAELSSLHEHVEDLEGKLRKAKRSMMGWKRPGT